MTDYDLELAKKISLEDQNKKNNDDLELAKKISLEDQASIESDNKSRTFNHAYNNKRRSKLLDENLPNFPKDLINEIAYFCGITSWSPVQQSSKFEESILPGLCKIEVPDEDEDEDVFHSILLNDEIELKDNDKIYKYNFTTNGTFQTDTKLCIGFITDKCEIKYDYNECIGDCEGSFGWCLSSRYNMRFKSNGRRLAKYSWESRLSKNKNNNLSITLDLLKKYVSITIGQKKNQIEYKIDLDDLGLQGSNTLCLGASFALKHNVVGLQIRKN